MIDILNGLSTQRAPTGTQRANHLIDLDDILKSPGRLNTPPPSEQPEQGPASRCRPASPDGMHTPPKKRLEVSTPTLNRSPRPTGQNTPRRRLDSRAPRRSRARRNRIAFSPIPPGMPSTSRTVVKIHLVIRELTGLLHLPTKHVPTDLEMDIPEPNTGSVNVRDLI